MLLDTKMDFQDHLRSTWNKITKSMSFLTKIPLLTIYKSFIRLHFDFSNIIYDETLKNSFPNMLDMMQYDAVLPMRSTSKEKIYQELGLETLQRSKWHRKIYYMIKLHRN